jgi:mannose-1-phosphate guanylyltransferase/phosphomannomutase
MANGVPLACALGAEVQFLEESEPLGTIGIAARLATSCDTLLVVNVDNLSSLNLRALVEHHLQEEASLTIATHVEPFRIPFGEVVMAEGRIEEYVEKPVINRVVSSGTYVLSQRACSSIPSNQRMDIPQLFRLLKEQGEGIVAFEHSDYWIDVNDATAVRSAEQLILAHHNRFELFRNTPDVQMATLLVESPSGFLCKKDSRGTEQRELSFPSVRLTSNDESMEQILRRFSHLHNIAVTEDSSLVTVFDEFDLASGVVARHHILRSRYLKAVDVMGCPQDLSWVDIGRLSETLSDKISRRALAALRIC